jgi:hypothetical protein
MHGTVRVVESGQAVETALLVIMRRPKSSSGISR